MGATMPTSPRPTILVIDRKSTQIGFIVASSKVAPRPSDIPTDRSFFRKPYNEEEVVAAIRGNLQRPGLAL